MVGRGYILRKVEATGLTEKPWSTGRGKERRLGYSYNLPEHLS